jgi:putative membrane protein
MTTYQFLTAAWRWNSPLLLFCALALVGYFLAFRRQGRPVYLGAALVVFLFALISPLSALADGYLFSAHMVQHILLVLIVPALLLLSLPRSFSLLRSLSVFTHPLIGWLAGVGAMWLWHAPTLCNAATTSRIVSAIQTTSLLLMGSVFWWQVLAPRDAERLSPAAGIVYLFTACTACSLLGIILTFAPVSICSVYQQPVDRLGMLGTIRGNWGLTSDRDQQIGGLLMWVPMCLIYLAAILAQLARWHSAEPVPHTEKSNA